MRRGVSVEIDLQAAAHNLASIRRAVDNLPVIAVVKADAYGHGAPQLSSVFEKNGASFLAVAFVSEAEELRARGVTAPILVLFDRTDPGRYFDLSLTPVVHDMKVAETFSKEASRRSTTLDVHVNVDTGMGRIGLLEAGAIERIASLPGLKVTGLMSHLSEADLADQAFAEHQVEQFIKLREALASRGIRPLCHIANSSATLSMPRSRMEAVRPGLALYGCSPFEDERPGMPSLRPLMTVKARIASIRRLGAGQPVSYGRTFISVRDTIVAVLAVGYADGYPRALSNASEVLVRGRRAPVLGRVCMDLTMVDVTDIEGVGEDDEAVLLGADGAESITAWELAKNASTIPYEIMTSLGCGFAARTYR